MLVACRGETLTVSGWGGTNHPRAKSGLGTDKSVPDLEIRNNEISATGHLVMHLRRLQDWRRPRKFFDFGQNLLTEHTDH